MCVIHSKMVIHNASAVVPLRRLDGSILYLA